MRKRTKIILGAIVIAGLSFIGLLIFNGLEMMAIEDHYGNLQNVYYRSETGDVIIDSNKRIGFIKKYPDRIYVEENGCMKDLYNWTNLEKRPSKLSVYRFKFSETSVNHLTFEQIINEIQKQKLEPIIIQPVEHYQ